MPQAIIVKRTGGWQFSTTIVEDSEDLVAFMAALGHKLVGYTEVVGPLRDELKNQPIFSGLIGPMWGGDEHPLRYEDQAAYDIISS